MKNKGEMIVYGLILMLIGALTGDWESYKMPVRSMGEGVELEMKGGKVEMSGETAEKYKKILEEEEEKRKGTRKGNILRYLGAVGGIGVCYYGIKVIIKIILEKE